MKKKDTDTNSNSLEEQKKDIEEWQKNSYNPGHYVGTGRIPTPVKNLYKSPLFILVMGFLFLASAIYALVKDFSFRTLVSVIVILTVGVLMTFGGIRRLTKK